MIVDLPDEPHVSWQNRFPDTLPGEGRARLHAHEGCKNRVRILTLTLIASDGQERLGPIHVVVGRRRHIGPVRIDVGEMTEPGRVGALLDELTGPHCHLGRLGMLLCDARRQV